MPSELSRIVIVTGATRGIGRALRDRLVELGHTVIGCGRSQAGFANSRGSTNTPIISPPLMSRIGPRLRRGRRLSYRPTRRRIL